jgi:WD40 repeat protein
MNTNKKLFIRLGIVIFMSIASPIKLHGIQDGWQSLLPKQVREIIIDLSPDVQEAINFLAWQPHHRLQGHNEDQAGLEIAIADGIIVTTSGGKTFAKVWDKNTYKEITTLKGHNGSVTSVAIADDIIITGSSDKTVKIWDRNSYKELATLKGHNGSIVSIAIADGIIVTGSSDKTAKVWDRNNYKEIATLTGHNESIASVAVADGIIITGSWDKTAKVWNKVWYWNSYKEITTLTVGSPVTSVAIADGIIVTGSSPFSGPTKVWDRNNYKEITMLRGGTGGVAIAGDIIVTGSFFEPTKVWDKNTYKEIGTLRRSVISVAVADDIILTGSQCGIVTVHDSKPFAGTVENNPLLWILSHATIQQWDFIERACENTKNRTIYGEQRYIYVSQKFSEIQKENEWQSESDGRTYFSFPEAVRQYLHNRLNILIQS